MGVVSFSKKLESSFGNFVERYLGFTKQYKYLSSIAPRFTTNHLLCATFISIIIKCQAVWYGKHPIVASGAHQSLTQWKKEFFINPWKKKEEKRSLCSKSLWFYEMFINDI